MARAVWSFPWPKARVDRPVATGACRRVSAGGDERLGLGSRTDHRADHAASTEIEGAHQLGGVVPGGANEGDRRRRRERSENVREVVERGVAVLEVHDDGVEAGRRKGSRGRGALEQDPCGYRGFAGSPTGANGIGGHGAES